MTRRGPAVVAVGEALAVVTPMEGRSAAQPARSALSIGGAEANVCIGLRRLGVPSAWIGRVGQDPFGDLVVQELTAEGVEVFARTDPDAPTGLVTRRCLSTKETLIHYDRLGSAGSRLHTGDLPAEVIGRASVLHISGVTPALSASAHMATLDAIAIARRMRVRVSFDVNHCSGLWSSDSSRDLYSEIIRRCDIVFAGEQEAQVVVGSASDPLELGDDSSNSALAKRSSDSERRRWRMSADGSTASRVSPPTSSTGSAQAMVSSRAISPNGWSGRPSPADWPPQPPSKPVRARWTGSGRGIPPAQSWIVPACRRGAEAARRVGPEVRGGLGRMRAGRDA